MHFYQFHIGDYKSHTHHLSPMEDLAFRRLLDHYYLHEQPIRQRDIARLIGLRDHEQEVLTVLDEFFISTENGYIHSRADEEIAKYRKLSEDGKRGAAKRWLKGEDSPPIATPIATKNQEPITINQEPKKKATSVACPDFVEQQVWNDWMTVRKGKGAKTLTETGWKKFVNQAEKAGWPLEQAISHCCLKNWISFEADWVEKKQSPADKRQNHMAQLTRGMSTPKPQPFWSQSKTVLEEIPNVEPKRLL